MQCPAPAATGGLKGTVATKMTKIIGPLKGSLLIAARSGSLREKGHSSLTEKKPDAFSIAITCNRITSITRMSKAVLLHSGQHYQFCRQKTFNI